MIKLFKIKKRKVWHILPSKNNCYNSYCGNGRTFDLMEAGYNPRIDEEYVDLLDVDEIPKRVHDSLCKACVQHAFSEGRIRIVANKGE